MRQWLVRVTVAASGQILSEELVETHTRKEAKAIVRERLGKIGRNSYGVQVVGFTRGTGSTPGFWERLRYR